MFCISALRPIPSCIPQHLQKSCSFIITAQILCHVSFDCANLVSWPHSCLLRYITPLARSRSMTIVPLLPDVGTLLHSRESRAQHCDADRADQTLSKSFQQITKKPERPCQVSKLASERGAKHTWAPIHMSYKSKFAHVSENLLHRDTLIHPHVSRTPGLHNNDSVPQKLLGPFVFFSSQFWMFWRTKN
jgi:hypothetical protein